MKKRLLVAAVALACAGAFFAAGGTELLSLPGLQARLEHWSAWRQAHPVTASALFFFLYVAITGLSLPGAAPLTLFAGALFGLVWGTILVSFASSLGALLAFWLSRFVLRDWVQARFGERLRTVNASVERDGAWFLFAARLVPVFPYFLINLLLGLTRMRAWTFYGISQIGMLPGTLVYVNAGRELAQLSSASNILAPRLLAAFALLALFPLLARVTIQRVQRQRAYARWARPRRFDRNLIVVGAGAAGLVAAYVGAAARARVTLVEEHKMGGECLHSGCVPSKALIAVSRLAARTREAHRRGLIAAPPPFSFREAMAQVRQAICKIAPHDSVERYRSLGVDVRLGHARLLDPWTVEIATPDGRRETLKTRAVVLATGARPVVPPLPGLEKVNYLTSETLWHRLAALDRPPARFLVLGGGAVGCELGQALARLGSQVTLVEQAPRLLIREDPEVSEFVGAQLENDGVQILTAHRARAVEQIAGESYLVVDGPTGQRRVPFDELLFAIGRRPRLEGYGLEELGIETEAHIPVNEYLETTYPNIYAAGDVTGLYQLTHAAGYQGSIATLNALFGRFKRFKADHSFLSWVTFVDPEVARVGLNETEAQQQGIPYEVTRYPVAELDRAIAEGETGGFIKVLTVPGRDRILGVTIVAAHAGEMVAEFVLAMKHRLGLSKILSTIHAYPTWAEANKQVAGVWRQAHTPALLLSVADRYHRWMRGGR